MLKMTISVMDTGRGMLGGSLRSLHDFTMGPAEADGQRNTDNGVRDPYCRITFPPEHCIIIIKPWSMPKCPSSKVPTNIVQI